MTSVRIAAFADLLRRYRRAASLTQEELAAAAGLSVRAVSDLERGLRRSPHRDTLHLLAEALRLGDAEREAFAAAAKRSRAALAPVSALSAAAVSPAAPPGGSMTVPLVGREHELARITALLAGEGPPALLLAGEPGIGKTRLLSECAALAAAAGWTVVRGGCHRRSGQEPYAPFATALGVFLAARSPAQQQRDRQGCAWLARLLPELAERAVAPASTWTLSPTQERRLMFAAVARYLANVAGTAGTLLLLDDLQWAGADALDLFAFLLREPPACPLRIVGAYRDTDLRPGDALSSLVVDLAHEGLATRLPIAGLPERAAAGLLGMLLSQIGETDAALQQVLQRRAGGVPFYLVTCVQELRAGAADPTRGNGGADGTLPWSVAESIRQRVTALPPSTQQLLGIAAVAGRQSARALLLDAATSPSMPGMAEQEVLAALDAAVHARLLLDDGSSGGYAFAHDLIRETIVADLGSARRAALHRAVAEALEGGIERASDSAVRQAAALAHHFAAGDLPARALPYALLAGEHAAAVNAFAEAERHYRMAYDLAQALGDDPRRAVAAEGLGVALGWQGRDEARPALEWALDTALERRDWAAVVRIVVPLTRPYVDQGRAREGIARIEHVRQMLDERAAPPDALATLDLALTHLYSGANQYAEMLVAAERMLAEASDDGAMRARGLWRRGAVLQLLARQDESLPDLQQAAAMGARAGLATVSMWAWHSAAAAQLHLGDLAAARQAAARALEAGESFGAPNMLAAQLSLAIQIAIERGDGASAHDLAGRMERLLPSVRIGWTLAMVAEARGRLALAAGDLDIAGQELDEALAKAQRSDDLQRIRAVQQLLAERDLLRCDPPAAIGRLAPLLDRPGLTETDVNALLPTLAEAYLSAGDIAQAEALIASTCDRLRAQHDRLVLAEALRIKALVALRQGRRGEAERALGEALVLCREMGAERMQARVEAVQRTLASAPPGEATPKSK